MCRDVGKCWAIVCEFSVGRESRGHALEVESTYVDVGIRPFDKQFAEPLAGSQPVNSGISCLPDFVPQPPMNLDKDEFGGDCEG